MSTMLTRLRNGLLAASVMGMAAFGATQALATPAEAAAQPACSQGPCNKQCEAQFGPFASGRCVNGVCECAA
jgi:hypothetical protein